MRLFFAASCALFASASAGRCALVERTSYTGHGGFRANYRSLNSFVRQKDAQLGFVCDGGGADAAPHLESFECDIPKLLWEHVVIIVEVSEFSLSHRLRAELEERQCDVLTCLNGVWWNSTAFRRANVLIVGDVCPGPYEVERLADFGANIRYVCHAKKGTDDQFTKTKWSIRRSLLLFPDALYVMKIDSDAVLFPDRLFSFVNTIHESIGTVLPVYFGTTEHTRADFGTYMQGHAEGWNLMALKTILKHWDMFAATPRLAQHLAKNEQTEDLFWGMLNEEAGSFFIECARFVPRALGYYDGNCPSEPITIHKAFTLPPSMRLDIPDRMCDETRGWKCWL